MPCFSRFYRCKSAPLKHNLSTRSRGLLLEESTSRACSPFEPAPRVTSLPRRATRAPAHRPHGSLLRQRELRGVVSVPLLGDARSARTLSRAPWSSWRGFVTRTRPRQAMMTLSRLGRRLCRFGGAPGQLRSLKLAWSSRVEESTAS